MATKKAAKSVKKPTEKVAESPVEKPAKKAVKKAVKTVVKKAVKKATKKSDSKLEALELISEAVASSTEPKKEIPAAASTTGIADPIGDVSDGEAKTLLTEEPEAEGATGATPGAVADSDAGEEADGDETGDDFVPQQRPPAKLERLQKILSQAGVASRRKAEEMIEQGRIQVNGKIVTTLGTKADANRDHIRVDGKLLHGAERLRYFVLNKPKGFVTTVKDPEGRPTVMQFFDKMHERLYPVGRLDYMSEGLLLVTNDGDLANKLTKAGSGVEKVYLVKVAGQPTEEELDLLRAGVNIERGKPGSPQVRTSPARIRQVRQGDNPWYEVVLIEGRNRELRKMFVAVGHFVEKIRRVGYGPLVLDQEPGNMRELDLQELAALRLAAEGKLRTPKSKDVRRRNLADGQLPTVRPKPSRPNPGKPFEARKPFEPAKPFGARKPIEPGEADARPAAAARPGEFRPRPSFTKDKPFRAARPAPEGFRPARPSGEGFRPAPGRASAEPGKFGARKFGPPGARPARPFSDKPAWKKDDRTPRPPARFAPDTAGEARPPAAKPYGDRPAAGRTFGAKPAGRTFGSKPAGRPFTSKPSSDRPAFNKPAWKKPDRSDRPAFKRSAAPRREPSASTEEFSPIKPGGLRIDPIEPSHADTRGAETRGPRTFSKPPTRPTAGRPPFDRPRIGKPAFSKPGGFEKPRFDKPRFDKPRFEKSGPAKPRFDKPRFERPSAEKPRFDRAASGRPSPDRPSIDARTGAPYRPTAGPGRSARPPREGGLARPFTTSSGKPRAGGARPSSKPFKPGGSSKPRPGGFSKSGPKRSGFKGKPGGKKRG
jgi:23S rRNA pseudouridine2605 synthase